MLAGKRLKLTLFTPLQPLNKDVPRCRLRYVTDLMLCCCEGFTSCFLYVCVSVCLTKLKDRFTFIFIRFNMINVIIVYVFKVFGVHSLLGFFFFLSKE